MRPKSLVIAVLLATFSSGCLFGPTVDCELSSELTQADCDHAIKAAQPQLANEKAATAVVVRPGCPYGKHCLAITNAQLITIQITFKGSDGFGEIVVTRSDWKAGLLHVIRTSTSQ